MNKPVSDYNSRSAIIGSNQIRFGRTLDEMSGFAPSESKKFVENYTRVFFQEKGYKYVNPEGLVPSDHSSILYTNSAVINLISQIKNNSFAGKFFCIQRCLRTQNLTQQNSEIPEYMSLFTMPGIFVEIEEYNSFCGDIIEFLGTLIPLSRFKIAFSNDHEIHKLYRQDSALENMDHPYEYYNRKFGSKTITGEKDTFSDSLTGEGASIMLNSGSQYEEIGNIIILKIDGKSSFACFGFGIETMLSILNNREIHQVYFSNIGNNLEKHFPDLKKPQTIRLIDLFQLLFELHGFGIVPENRGRGHIMTKILKKIQQLALELKLSQDQIEAIFLTQSDPDKLLQYFKNYNKKND